MSHVTGNQPYGTPTWIDLGIPDLDRAMAFYRALFGWEFDVGPAETGHYTICLLDGRPVAAIASNAASRATDFWWNMYLATDDCDGTAKRIVDAGGTLIEAPTDVMDAGRLAIARDPVGAQFGLWEGRAFLGAQVVNEPGALLRNDLVTPTPEAARAFYAAVFDFTLDGDSNQSGADFTFLRRPDGHEVGGIMGDPAAVSSNWGTLFEVTDTDDAVARAIAAGGAASEPSDIVYGRIAQITDPFGTPFSVGARPRQRS
jgi:uncharacterized protein